MVILTGILIPRRYKERFFLNLKSQLAIRKPSMKKKAISLINYFIYRLKEKHLLLLYKLIGKKLQMEKENIVIQYEYGHYQSKKKQSAIDKFGNPLPWFTYPAIE